jgi:sulfate/thiosulfate transport system ATP-binding protein
MNTGRIEQIGTAEEVYHHPVNAFVHNFLGNVNLFHGRIENGKVYIGDTPVEVDDTRGASGSGKAVLALRPHLIEIIPRPNGKPAFPATVTSINPAGPQVKVELLAEWGDFVQVDVGHDRFQQLALTPGAHVFLRPKEEKLFVYQI